MCGIVGLISKNDVVNELLDGLKRLEYRGYDSAGIATIHKNQLERRRAEGKLKALYDVCLVDPIRGAIGIGHTRWATHGPAIEINAHPHANHRLALVHNGIIENYSDLKASLEMRYTFSSQTDTEVIVHLIEDELKQGHQPLEAIQRMVKKLKGAYALAILFKDDPTTLYAVRQGSPLVIGISDAKVCLGSDAISCAPFAEKLAYLEDGDMATLTLEGDHGEIKFYDQQDQPVLRPFVPNPVNIEAMGKGQYRHYMLKEIFEQPTVIAHGLQHILAPDADHVHIPQLDISFEKVQRLTIIACGTSYYAGLLAKYWFEKYARLSVDVDIASEFRYRSPVFSKNHVCFFISQSGETLDTLAALELCKRHTTTIGLVNVPQSSIARMAHNVLLTHAGPEIGVASTKALTSQLLSLFALSLDAARQRGHMDIDTERDLVQSLRRLPSLVQEFLAGERIEEFSQALAHAHHVIFLGRGPHYPLALEGALKLKEITYIPAEGYASGELKHGVIALIDEKLPVFFIAPYDTWFEKSMGNIQEVFARKGKITVITDARGASILMNALPQAFTIGKNIILMPKVDQALQPFLSLLPLQLLAYYTGVKKGTDVDQPRNLAKSVTVE